MDPKAVAAARAVSLIQNQMVIGLGSGTTATIAIQLIGERLLKEGIKVTGVPTSSRTDELAEKLGIPLVDLTSPIEIDMTIDGADEVDPALHLIKGGGGALVREKLVAAASKQVVIICDGSKIKPRLGQFPVPVAVVRFGWQATCERLRAICGTVTLRVQPGTQNPYLTDDKNYIIDCHFGTLPDPAATEKLLRGVIGVVEVGLFINLASRVIVGNSDGTFEEKFATNHPGLPL